MNNMNFSQEPISVKVVVVGDGSVGKTCILLSYTTDKFPTEYVPTVFDNYTSQVEVDGQMVNLSLWDTAGQETYNRLRTLSYGQADIFLIVFSVDSKSSFENAVNKWYPELSTESLSETPKIFVGNKIDKRKGNMQDEVMQEAAKAVIEEKGCLYIECSALTQVNLKEIFDQSVREVIKRNKNRTTVHALSTSQKSKAELHDQEKGFCGVCKIF